MVSKTNTDYVRFQSWGRTRSPKNILSSHRSGVDGSGTALTLASADPGAGDGTPQSFDTENQRYLHVLITDDDSGDCTLKVEGEMYAAATYTAVGQVNTFQPVPLKTTANTATTALAAGYHLIEIAGIDRVRFTATGAAKSIQFYAACSTFSMS